MRLLIDTQIIIWFLEENKQLSATTRFPFLNDPQRPLR